MSNSPHILTFQALDATGAPLTGAAGSFSFLLYADDQGTSLTSPTITELSGGLYKFTPNFSVSPARGVVYVLDLSASAFPRYYSGYIRPEDWEEDKIEPILSSMIGKLEIFNSGPDNNRAVLYYRDGVTVLAKFDLQDIVGNPSISNVFRRIPV